jgi:glycosyltransferase involved in cell wall biosynthesis
VALGEAAAAMIGQRERWSKAGLQRARKFSWGRTARETISTYESVLR